MRSRNKQCHNVDYIDTVKKKEGVSLEKIKILSNSTLILLFSISNPIYTKWFLSKSVVLCIGNFLTYEIELIHLLNGLVTDLIIGQWERW